MNPNNFEVMGNPNKGLVVDNFNQNVQQLHSYPNDQVYFSDNYHRSLFQFPLCIDQIPNPINPLSSMNYEPLANFFPTGEDPGMGTSNCVVNSSSQGGLLANNKSDGGKKRKRNDKEKEAEKAREVVHVRAKRGEATDSHSLAERSRREKINVKLRCLQDLVPGCYKTMGMAVMLDVIINYVRALQNQIDFLSMQLSSASLFYESNSNLGPVGTMQQGSNVYEEQGLENLIEGYVMQPQIHANWPC